MSFSNKAASTDTSAGRGRIVLGANSVSLADLSMTGSHQSAWSQEAEEEYLARVRGKAQAMAKDILAQAIKEAEEIRSAAHQEGLEEGRKAGQKEMKKAGKQVADQGATLLKSLREQSDAVLHAHREDLVLLLQVMVEKVLAVELDAHRGQSLSSLLNEAVEMIEAKRRVIISVHPKDAALMQELVGQLQGDEVRSDAWKVKEDDKLQPGGLILECDHGMVDNSIASRRAGLQAILEQLTLEDGG